MRNGYLKKRFVLNELRLIIGDFVLNELRTANYELPALEFRFAFL